MENSADPVQFIGRLHVVFLHLPIGFLVLLALLEGISMVPRWRHATLSSRFVLWLTVPATLVTAVCGWLLAEEGGYDRRLLLLHRWTGVAVAAAACGLLWVHCRGWMGAYRVLILLVLPLTMVAGHLGGSLTHGSDYLTRHAPVWIPGAGGPTRPSGSRPGGFAVVERVLSEYCVSCHGPEKTKGGLRLDGLEHVLAGGDSGAAVLPGDAAGSLLMQRISLPVDDDDHMPPEGKPQPSMSDIELVRNWIEAGAVD